MMINDTPSVPTLPTLVAEFSALSIPPDFLLLRMLVEGPSSSALLLLTMMMMRVMLLD